MASGVLAWGDYKNREENITSMRGTHKKMLVAMIAVVALASLVVGCGQNTVAKVNGVKITRQQYDKKLERVTVPSMTGQQQEAGERPESVD